MRAGISFQLWGEGPPSGDREEAGQGNLERQLSRVRCTRPHQERKPLEGAACEPGHLLPVNSPSQAGGLLTRPTMPLGYCFKFESLQQITVLSPSQQAPRTRCHSDVLFACLS